MAGHEHWSGSTSYLRCKCVESDEQRRYEVEILWEIPIESHVGRLKAYGGYGGVVPGGKEVLIGHETPAGDGVPGHL